MHLLRQRSYQTHLFPDAASFTRSNNRDAFPGLDLPGIPEEFSEPGEKSDGNLHGYHEIAVYLPLHKLAIWIRFNRDLLNPALHPVPEQEAAGEITPAEEVLRTSVTCIMPINPAVTPATGKTSAGGGGDDTAEAGGFSPGGSWSPGRRSR